MSISVPGYRTGALIYEGPRSRVVRGEREADGKRVIVKVHRSEHPAFTELAQYRNHYMITRSLDVHGVDRPLALESHGHGFALIMEDTGGVSLRDHVRRTPAGPAEALAIGVQVARILEGIHARRIIHKDIKPDNLVVHAEAGAVAVALIDFSIATLLSQESREMQRLNALEGTLSYISPEQTGRMNRWVDHRSDHYSLGVTLYELLTGQLPFASADPMELIHAHIARRPVPPAEVNPAVPQVASDIVMKLLAKSADDRYQSASGLLADLEACLDEYRSTGAVRSFPLGGRDLSDRFVIPDRLYGREAEVATLMSAFERASGGSAELMLVAGHSGIGKSVLVHEVHRPIVRLSGYFVSGKFDQLRRDIPFSSLVQAFRDLLRQILTERAERVAAWRARLSEALGGEAQVIADVIPELEVLLGEQPPVAALSPADNQDRWNRLFQRFIRVFAAPDHPLVIFLDDLQWADSASLTLLEMLLREPETRCLLLICAYRDNEVGPAHPFQRTMEKIRAAGAAVTQITLQPLALPDLSVLIGDTLRCPPERSLDLTHVVFHTTQGNPFFTNQFMRSLHRDGLIVFDAAAGRFRYDLAVERASSGSSDVVEFMIDQLRKLPPETQSVLRLSAAVGNRFDLATLAVVHARSAEETAGDLWPALNEGLVLPVDDAYRAFQQRGPAEVQIFGAGSETVSYRFLHDRVQQAAYAMIPAKDRPETHLRIGRLLLRSTPAADRDERLFDIVNQLDTGAALIDDPAERIDLARLNLTAGVKAKASTAYGAAARYLATGLELLDERSWEEHHDLALVLHREGAEVEHLEGSFERSEGLIRCAIAHGRTPLEKAETYNALIVQYTVRAMYAEAIQAGREALSLIGVDLPVDDLEAARDALIAEVRAGIGGRPIASLYDLPDMTAPEQKAAVKLLTTMGPPCYRSHQALWAVLCSKAVSLSLSHGNAPQAAYSHTSFGGLLSYVAHDHRACAELGALALRLSEKFQNPSDQSVAWLMIGSSVRHWTEPMRQSSADYQKAYSVGLDAGNLQYAAYAFGHNMVCRFYQGVPLDQLLTEIAGYLPFSQRRKNRWAIDLLDGGRILASNLAGLTAGPDDFSIADLALTEAQFLERCEANKNGQVLCIYDIMKSQVLYLHGALRGALACSRAADERIASVATQGLLPSAEHVFVQSLILTALHPGATEAERAGFDERLEGHRRLLAMWAESSPDNFLHKHQLVSAEAARISGRVLDAVDLYDLAIESAHAGELSHNAALASELAARCWLHRGKEKLARPYLREAYAGYVRWGARAKVEQLERDHGGLLGSPEAARRPPVAVLGTLSADAPSELLDVATVLKASQAIFSEIQLDKLLAKLLRITMESAGAERGFLLLPKDASFTIEASVTGSDEDVSVLRAAPVRGSAELSEGIVHRVARTGEALALDDAAASDVCADDPHVAARRPRSLLCMPAFHHGTLAMILYLDNTLAEGCFTPARLEVVRVLMTQAAIAVQNALLYADVQRATEAARAARDHLEVEVTGRTEELRKANGRLIERTEELRQANTRLEQELAERTRAERERAALQEEVITAQRARLEEMSTPLIPITSEIMVMPLIGTMDVHRAGQMLEAALRGAQSTGAKVVILDITGMRHMDSGVAGMLLRAASALRLLGTQAVLTGIRPELAQALVGLDVDMSGIITRGTLQSGIAHAMGRLLHGGR